MREALYSILFIITVFIILIVGIAQRGKDHYFPPQKEFRLQIA